LWGVKLYSTNVVVVTECGAVYNATEGTIRSPGYPDYYPNNANCTYDIVGDVHKTTILQFVGDHFAVGQTPSGSAMHHPGAPPATLFLPTPDDITDPGTFGQEAQLSPSDRAMRLVSSNLASYHATVPKLLIRQVQTKPMV